MIKTSRCLGRSLFAGKCYRSTVGMAVLTFCALLPFVSFGGFEFDGYTVERMRFFSWTGYLTTPASSRVPTVFPSSFLELRSTLMSSTFGILVHTSSNPSNKLLVPSAVNSLAPFYEGSVSRLNITNSVYVVSNGVGYVVSPMFYPDLASVYQSVAMLYFQGYRGPGIVDDFSQGVYHCVNVDYPRLVSDVLCSTNTLFRQILLSHISAISSSVQNIDLNVSGLQSSIDQGNSILQNINSSSSASASSLYQVSSNTAASASSLYQVSSNTAASASSLYQVSSNTAASVSSLYQVSSNTAASASSLYQVSSNTAASAFSLSDISGNTAASASALSDISDNSSSIASDVGSIKSDTYYLHGDVQELVKQGRLNSYVGAALSGNGLPDPDNPFFPYDPNNPEDPNHPDNPNSPWNPNSPNSLAGGGAQGAFTTNNVVKPITNTVKQASSEIQSNAVENADRQIDNANQNWQEFKDLATGDGEGLNVRIKFPLTEENPEYHVNVKDTAVLSAIENLHAMPVELTAIKDNIQWFRDGGPININLPTNLVDMLDAILDAITNRPENTYLLLDDYAVYISNGVYQTSIEQLANDFPNVYTNLQKYGLTSSGNGNFWTLFGANLIYQSGFIGSLLEDMATIRKFADDHIEGGFAAGIKSIVDKFPSPSQLEDDVNNATNRLLEISLAMTNLVFSFESVTNLAPSVFRPFGDSFDTPPSGDIVFFKTANNQYVSIPVHEQASVWSLIRRGIGFALIGVQFLLFPKFVLMIVVLFDRLSSRFVKFVPTDR